jgi:hypothetical protein
MWVGASLCANFILGQHPGNLPVELCFSLPPPKFLVGTWKGFLSVCGRQMAAARSWRSVAVAALLVVLIALPNHASSVSLCDGFNDGVDGSSYWEQVANCTSCAGTPSCGFCLSTLLCSAGDSHGASDGKCPPSHVSVLYRVEFSLEQGWGDSPGSL